MSAADELWIDRQNRITLMELADHAPESIRERLAAEFAAEDAHALLHPPANDRVEQHWEMVQEKAPWRADFYRRLADRALSVITESALR